ncbi:MAG TPA: hypothetical protein VFT81_07520 [Dermatophilaceae bacterium]|nr:hypothetical protein [Dermatophilaceae bacterium]
MGVIGVLGFAGCAANPQVEFARPTRPATVTVTVTTTVNGIGPVPTITLGPTSTSTSTGTPTVTTVAPMAGAVSGPASAPTATTLGAFDRAGVDATYQSIIAGVAVLDGQFASGASPSLRLDVLATDLGTLATLGVPPGLDGPSYLSRVRTLETFADAAAQESLTDRTRATARYEVVRRETSLLLTQVNDVLGTTYALPVAAPLTAQTPAAG